MVVFTVVAIGNPPCGNSEAGTTECATLNCSPLTINLLNEGAQYCVESAAVDLTANPSGGVFSGPGISNNQLDPASAGIGEHTMSYLYTLETGCEYTATANFTIHAVPIPNFEINPFFLCADGVNEATITFTGTTYSNNAIFNWNFNGGTLVAGTGAGPLAVAWENVNGTATVSLSIEENGCISPIETNTINLESPLSAPDVICTETSNNSVSFAWQHVDLAFGYEISYTINGGSPITASQIGNEFEVEGLNLGDVVEITVIAIGDDPCGNGLEGVATCTVEDCPELALSIDNLSDTYCSDEGIIVLEATPTGGIFSGEGVNGNELNLATVNGNISIQYAYTDPSNDCTYNTSIGLTVIEVPIADFEIDPMTLCADGNMEAIVTFTGEAPLDATFNWNFGGGTASPGTGFGPHTVTWTDAQANNEISLEIDNEGCTSNTAIENVTLIPPITDFDITCVDVTTSSIRFDWNDIPAAEGYEISYVLNGGNIGSPTIITASEFTLNDFATQDSIEFFVTAIATEPCASVTVSTICSTQNCPEISLEVNDLNEVYCMDEPAFELSAVPIGGIFMGQGIEGENVFNPSNAQVGPNETEYQYIDADSGCSFNLPFSIQVEEPLATPFVSCLESTQNSISFDWENVPNATAYEITYTINNGNEQTEIVSTSPFELNGLSPQDAVNLTVTSLGEGICGNSETASTNCVAQDCPPMTVSIDNLEDAYCQDIAPFPLAGSPLGGTFRINGVVYNASTDFFAPSSLEVGEHLVEYILEEGDCAYSVSTNVEILAVPIADFTIDSTPICLTERAIITYIGSSNSTAIFDWDFDGGNAENTGNNMHQVSWNTEGDKNIRLQVIENGCVSTIHEQQIEVIAPLEAVNINCGESTPNSVAFDWSDLGGVYEFEVTYTVNGVNSSSYTTTDNFLEVNGLSPQDEVELEVIVLNDGVCGNSPPASHTCIAQDCEPIDLSIEGLGSQYCSDAENVVLIANHSGGIFYVNGAENTDLQPSNWGAGTYLVEYFLEEGNCAYDADFEVEIIAALEAVNINCGTTSTNSVAFDWSDLGGVYEFEVTYTVNGVNSSSYTTTDNFLEVNGLSPQNEVELEVIVLNDGVCGNSPAASHTCVAQDCEPIDLSIEGLGSQYCSDAENVVLIANHSGGIFYVNGAENTDLQPSNWGAGTYLVEYLLEEGNCAYGADFEVEIVAALEAVNINCGTTSTNSVAFDWSDLGGVYEFEVTYTVNGVNSSSYTTTDNFLEVNGLSPQDEVELEVIVLNDGVCGNSPAASHTCIAQDCEPIDLSIEGLGSQYCSDAENVVLIANHSGGIFYVNGAENTDLQPSSWGAGTYLVEYFLEEGNCAYDADFEVEIVAALEAVNINCGTTSTNSVAFDWSDLGGVYEFEVTYTVNGVNSSSYTTTDNFLEVNGLSPQDKVELEVIVLNDGVCGNSPPASHTCIAQDCEPIDLSIEGLGSQYCSDAENVVLIANHSGGIFYVNGAENTDLQPSSWGAGTYLVEYLLEEGNCAYGADFEVEIVAALETPLVNCSESTVNSVRFEWAEIVGNSDYQVVYTINGQNSREEILSEANILIEDLLEGDRVDVEVIALGDAPCGNSLVVTAMCETLACPTVSWNLPIGACLEEEISLELHSTFGEDAEYMWTAPNGFLPETMNGNDFNFLPEEAGWQVLQLEVMDNNGCMTVVQDSIFISDFQVDTEQDTTIWLGTSMELSSEITGIHHGDLTYLWTSTEENTLSCMDCPTPIVSPQNPANYELLIEDANGCTAKTAIFIDLIENYQVIAPNAFSPNGDGVNDFFQVLALGMVELELAIYNRWGQEVFRTQDGNSAWNGRYQGENQPIGVYAFHALVRFVNGSEQVVQGNLTLIR